MDILKIDMSAPGLGQKLLEAFSKTGFAVITNHPIDTALMEKVYVDWAWFFESETKFAYNFNPETQAGYFPFKSENAKGYSIKDLKEFYHLFYPYRDLPVGVNETTRELAARLQFLGYRLLDSLSEEILHETGRNFSLGEMAEGSTGTLFRVLHYPPLEDSDEKDAVRAAAHEDINLLTLLPAATAPGLEVKDLEGNWHKVECDPGSIIVNVGDMLQEATESLLKSTTHRVVNPDGPGANVSRYSMPLFLHARSDVRLSEKYTAGEYLAERLKEIGLTK